MAQLPIRRMVIYKHGVGYFERRGSVEGATLRLSFPREAMDDVLKSLVALDLGGGQVLGIDFETPEDRAARLSKGSIHLSDARSLLDLLRDLRGRLVRLHPLEGGVGGQRRDFGLARPKTNDDPPALPEPAGFFRAPLEGLVVGVDVEEDKPLQGPLVSLYVAEQREVRPLPVRAVGRVELLDQRAAEDLDYFLRAAQSEADRRSATLQLSDGAHDLLVGYVAPAPAWRVSYRLLFETPTDDAPPSVLLQGWGLFDNQLEEDLENVEVTLVAGMPVSFRYRLYEPHTPERPLVQDEERTVAAPIEFAGMIPQAPPAMLAAEAMPDWLGMGAERVAAPMAMPPPAPKLSAAAAEESVVSAGVGTERGALFQYRVAHPISVARGQSAMVPIVGQRIKGRKELLYNAAKFPEHPVAGLRLQNETGLTLERGPVTVIEDGDYAGEAVLPFTRTGADMIVPYAVELGIKVHEEQQVSEAMHSIRVRNDYLLVQVWTISLTRYHIHNTLEQAATVTVEQALLANYNLHDTPDPLEQAQGAARWEVACAPGVETVFEVRQRRSISRREEVRNTNGEQLKRYFEGKYLDAATYEGLQKVLQIYNSISELRARANEIEQQRKGLYKRQEQTRTAMGPLKNEGDEAALRARYVAALNAIENDLERLATDEQQITGQITQLERQAKDALGALG